MLVGKYQNSIDTKSRMIVPAKFRDELGHKCVVSKALDKCLEIHPMSEWERFMEKLSKLPSADPKARQLARHFYASAVECEIDKQGRLTLPQELRQYAKIEKDLVTIGSYEKIEVWSKEEWESSEITAELDPSQLAESMMRYDF
ncbi:MAG: division/cell wall cluster transcriptional repressor MraZ [Firmicutes bacterium]|nr:division/cell wall cluster transcriptional repressor MraZ [Bacillota bacterium]